MKNMKQAIGMTGALLLLLALSGVSTSMIAQSNPGGSITKEMRTGLIDFSKEMNRLIEGVKSVADAEKAEPKIAAAMNKLAAIVVAMAENLANMTTEQGEEIANLGTLMEDPEVVHWTEKAANALDELTVKNPEAAAKIEEIGNRHSGAFVEAMNEIQRTIQGAMEKAAAAGETE